MKETFFDIPILLLFFNRPAHAEALIEKLKFLRPSKVYIHIDGARTHRKGETKAVLETQEAIKNINWPCEKHCLIRSANQGLRKGVKGALDWFFEEEEMGIILEDDCQPDASFFPFCKEMLLKYADNEQIMHVGANNLTEAKTQNLEQSYVFSRFSFVWGWASWRRAWQRMNIDLDGLDSYASSSHFEFFLPSQLARVYMLDKFQVTAQKRNNSWAYAWFYSILKNDGLCIVPSINLTQNTGIGDVNATNTKVTNKKAALAARTMVFPLQHPQNFEVDPALELAFFYDSQKSLVRLGLWYAKRQLIS